MPDLPTGTVTFLFTDLEGSTELAHRLGDEWHGVLVQHRNLVRSAINDAKGSEIDCRGDEFFVAFEDANAAAQAAISAQQGLESYPWPEEAVLRARMGMHTGEAIFADEDYLGVDVHRAARICFAGHGRQVLISEATDALLSDDHERRDLGTYRLRGLPEPERIFQLLVPGLPGDFAALRSASGGEAGPPLRVVLADDSVLLREGIAMVLDNSGFEVVGQSDDAEDLLRKVEETMPDVVIADIRMPPGNADDGVKAAETIRRRHPGIAVLLLSQHAEPAYARDLLANGAERVGYLLKDRVSDLDGFADAVRRIAAGEVVMDPEIRL